MKNFALALIATAGLASVAATCTVTNTSLNTIDGRATAAGEVRNEMPTDILNHRIVIGFLDEDGNVLETKTTNGCLRSLQSGASNFYSVASGADEDEVATALARVAADTSLELGEVKSGEIRIRDVAATRKDDLLIVSGTLRNDEGEDLDDVRVCVVVYGDDGQVVLVDVAAEEHDLDEDGTQEFVIELDVPDDADLVDEVSVWVDAERDGTPTAPQSRTGIDVECEPETPTSTATSTATPEATATAGAERHQVC